MLKLRNPRRQEGITRLLQSRLKFRNALLSSSTAVCTAFSRATICSVFSFNAFASAAGASPEDAASSISSTRSFAVCSSLSFDG